MTSDANKTYIETLLPDAFLLSLGKYLQLCAHIEFWTCALVACLHVDDPQSDVWLWKLGSFANRPPRGSWTSFVIPEIKHGNMGLIIK